ncbi:MAG: hypothetical protein QHH01_06050 [Spirochaetales bacterium]|nr:hypothetical protein [Spirochaetales bacterium]
MKKALIVLTVLAAALVLTGCPVTHSQQYPNYTLPIFKEVTTTTVDNGITVTAVDTANEYSTYDITINGLVADVGKKFVVAGASIGSTTTNIGDNWNVTEASVTDPGLVAQVDATGTWHIMFYGKAPSWANAADGAQFKVCIYDDPTWNPVLARPGNSNFYVEGATGKDITIVIDPNQF